MTVFDDKTEGIIKVTDRKNCFIIHNVECQTDVVFKTSYIVAAGLQILGKITAQFDLIVLGDVKAKEIDVKGEFICIGDCVVEDNIVVHDRLMGKLIKAKSIEVHDQIVAQEIDAKTILADDNIIVGQTLAIESYASSGRNILCGETAYGAGKIAARAVLTVDEIDMDDGVDAVINPHAYEPPEKEEPQTGGHIYETAKQYEKKNDYEGFLTALDKSRDNAFKTVLVRWRKALRTADEMFQAGDSGASSCRDIGLLLNLTEIINSEYFKEWDKIKAWQILLLHHFNDACGEPAEGTLVPMEIEDFTLGKHIVHKVYGEGDIVGERFPNGKVIKVKFDNGEIKEFKPGSIKKTSFFLKVKASSEKDIDIIDRFYIRPSSYEEWLAFLKVLQAYGVTYSAKLAECAYEMLYTKIGLKAKFIADRIKENGWGEK